ncbi:putative vacuolar protein sorting-associated protein [Helianthus debilis subsp. tardiflorus]
MTIIIASFLPGDSYSSYNSTQETLRTLLHSVIKVPEIKSKTVELNGVLVTHALITLSELSIKCAQHYSWYVMRAIYIAKGSPLLPPAFASIFDDLASSSLDVFFDPSSALVKLPGLTLGTFKLLSKCIDGKGFSGTKRYLGDLGKTLKTAGSNILFAAVTEVSDAVLKGAETNGFNGMFNGFQQGILKLAMEPSVLGSAFTEGGPDRKIKLDRNPGVDELYIEGYLQAMLDTMYKYEYLRVRVIDDQVVLKNMPPNSVLIDEIMDHVKGFLVSKGLLTGETSSYSLRHLRVQNEWRIVPTVLTLCEHLFVNFAIGWLKKQAGDLSSKIKWDDKFKVGAKKAITKQETKVSVWKWGVGRFVFAGILAYVDGRLCRSIPNPVARRIVSGFVLSFLDRNDDN